MERLIPSPCRTAPPFARPRPPVLLRRPPSYPKHSLPWLPRNGFKPVASLFSKRVGPPPPHPTPAVPSSSSSLSDASASRSAEEARKAQLFPERRASAGSILRKISSFQAVHSAVLVLASAIIFTIIQPILVPPSYATVQSAARSGGRLIRTELLSSAWTGFLAGCLHTLSGPDHLAALAPLSIGRTRIESAVVGALWGCGHDTGQVVFGLLFLMLKDRMHIEVIRTWGTRVVGLTLLVIGAIGFREASEVPMPCVALENGECDVSIYEHLDAGPTGKKKFGFATFATGIVHGLQPDALMMVLPALALPSRLAGAAFLCMFLVGTVFAMASYTVFIGSFTQALKERVPRITEKLTWAASLVAISMGLAILISQFFGFSLY
ncbi:chloroplast protein FOR GROWTH AND FERTILITY 2-like isoform X1 [Musa acuminata AAA Group]|uniref:chloroplast protein FOR GROWTH AND FERTILITY 2-like isoform X1 n=1 Tax=Musa acuminata AAA Group TaxID=214697 RepID=UPI0031DE1F29